MAKRDWQITIEGLEEVEELFEKLPQKLNDNFWFGFNSYVEKHLVKRMKARLAKASQPQQGSHTDPNTGITMDGGGGYGTPQNSPKYAEWKKSRVNLPQVGDLSPRELVATGHLVDSIAVIANDRTQDSMSFTVGAKPGMRPSVQPFVNSKGFQEVNQADLSREIDNTKLMEWIEDSKYAFLAKEYEDVFRDVEPIVLSLLKTTLLQLAKEIQKKGPKPA